MDMATTADRVELPEVEEGLNDSEASALFYATSESCWKPKPNDQGFCDDENCGLCAAREKLACSIF